MNIAEVEHKCGRTLQAIELLQETLPLYRSGDRQYVLANLAGYLIAVDDFGAADAAAREAVQLGPRHDADAPITGAAIEHLALSRALAADGLDLAATLMGYVENAYHRLARRANRPKTKRIIA